MLKLNKLSGDLLKIDGDFHEATFDVYVLQLLSTKFIPLETLLNCKTWFLDCLLNEINKKKATVLLPAFKVLKGVVSHNMIKKIANAGISFDVMLQSYKNNVLMQLLLESYMGEKTRVTKDKKSLKKIINFFEMYK